MPLSDLVTGGPACGPSNPLQSLGKRFGQDRSAQLDRYSGGQGEGSSSGSQSFRAPRQAPQGNADAAFFHQGPSNAFNLQPLQSALPLQHSHAAQLHHAPLDLNSAWEQRQMQRQRQGQQGRQNGSSAMATKQFDASFRHSPTPAESQWARDYSQAASPAQQADEQQQHYTHQQPQQLSHATASHPMYGMPRMTNMRANYSNAMAGPMQYSQVNGIEQHTSTHQQSATTLDPKQWDTAFTSIEQGQTSSNPADQALGVQQDVQTRPLRAGDADEFAKTAGRLVSSVEHEQNDKFKQSNFLNLMRKIRDRQAGIEGTDIVEQEGVVASDDQMTSLDKGKSKAMDGARSASQLEEMGRTAGLQGARQSALGRGPTFGCLPNQMNGQLKEDTESRDMLNDMWAEEDARSEAIENAALQRAQTFLGDGGDVAQRQREDEAEFAKYQNILSMGSGSAGLAATAFLQQQQGKNDSTTQQLATNDMEEVLDELEGADFVGKQWEGTKGRGVHGAQVGEWDTLQKDWDAWQATSTGFQPSMQAPLSAASAPQYRFHAYNPYIGTANAQQASTTSMPADMQSVLEREAAVQADPRNAGAWLDLGIKQQENEREEMAIAALQRAIEIEPTLREAWLALAVSYTNESDRSAALEAIERWIDASPDYREIVAREQKILSAGNADVKQAAKERHDRVTNLLMALARHGSSQSNIDANVQVALGVLFNASEDYDKAVDCFQTALHVRPDDWLLYNRLGATLSNSGRSGEALRFYQQALELKPGFVRCHFNMSISCLNLKMYREAASHIYTALLLQSESIEADASKGGMAFGTNGIASSSLWETLRVACELMNRSDLAMRAVERNLDAIDPSAFWQGADDAEGHPDGDNYDLYGASAGLSGAQNAY